MQTLFSFTYNDQTKEAAFAGNIDALVALRLLQDIVISQARQQPKPEEVKEDAKPATETH